MTPSETREIVAPMGLVLRASSNGSTAGAALFAAALGGFAGARFGFDFGFAFFPGARTLAMTPHQTFSAWTRAVRGRRARRMVAIIPPRISDRGPPRGFSRAGIEKPRRPRNLWDRSPAPM